MELRAKERERDDELDMLTKKGLGEFGEMDVFCFVVMNNDYEASCDIPHGNELFCTHNTYTNTLTRPNF